MLMTKEQPGDRLGPLLGPHARACQRDIDLWLIEPGTPAELAEAMRYCIEGGKRLRAAMVFLGAQAVGGRNDDEMVRRSAVAVECVHAYSLVHDDLPGMDNDTLRRGRRSWPATPC